MFKLPAGAKLVKVTPNDMTRVHVTPTSLHALSPQPLKVGVQSHSVVYNVYSCMGLCLV